MNRMSKYFIATTVALLLTTYRSPAPILEIETPTPTPARKPKVATTTATPAAKTSKPKTLASPKTEPQKTVAAKQNRFAGTWVGTMPTFPAGDKPTVMVIDSNETTMTVTWFGKTLSAKALIAGDTLQATFPPPAFQPQSHAWSITPQPDGRTARVHFQCFMNDATVVFQRK
jgi:hypothetical protein